MKSPGAEVRDSRRFRDSIPETPLNLHKACKRAAIWLRRFRVLGFAGALVAVGPPMLGQESQPTVGKILWASEMDAYIQRGDDAIKMTGNGRVCLGDKIYTFGTGQAKFRLYLGLAFEADYLVSRNGCFEIIAESMGIPGYRPKLIAHYGLFYVISPRGGNPQSATPNSLIRDLGTRFTVESGQHIACVQDHDLWMMNGDGTGRTPYIAAPTGKRVGRSTFSPDGGRVCYEVWDCGGDEYPETSELWIADADGSNARLLLNAGGLSDPTGRDPFVFRRRLLWGPCFSPDGERVSCLRLQVYTSHSGVCLLDQEVGTVPVIAPAFHSLWRTTEGFPYYSDAAAPMRDGYWTWYMGMNTAWSPPGGEIAFRRTGSALFGATYWVESDSEKTAWPVQLAFSSAYEGKAPPTRAIVTLDGEAIDMLGAPFVGYGTWLVGGGGLSWQPHPAGVWQSFDAGAGYGTVQRLVAQGDHLLAVDVECGGRVLRGSHTFHVGENGGASGREGWCEVAAWGDSGGVWAIPATGGQPRQLMRAPATSLAWNGEGNRLAAAYSGNNALPIRIYDATGALKGTTAREPSFGPEVCLGNWDAAGQWVVTAGGAGGLHRVRLFDRAGTSGIDLGPGQFPVFAPLYRSAVSVFEGQVSITDTRGAHEARCLAGQRVATDSLENGGEPQGATALRGPYASRVIPAWGSAVPSGVAPAVTFQFTMPIAVQTLLTNRLTIVSWPGVEPTNREAFLLNATLCAQSLNHAKGQSAFNDTVANLEALGVGTGEWNGDRTQWTFTITQTGFPCWSGYWCDVSLDLSGVQGTNGLCLPLCEASTQFRFVDPIGPDGGSVRSLAGGELTVPPGALGQQVSFEARTTESLDEGTQPPTASGWKQASSVLTLTPASPAFAAPVTVSLPVLADYPEAAIWHYDGARWTELGGAYDAGAGAMRVPVGQLGTFCVFHPVPTAPRLLLTQSASAASALAGDTVTVWLLVENLGGSGATGVVVSDTLAAGLHYVNGSMSAGGAYDAEAGTLTWNLGALAGETTRWLQFSATLDAAASYGMTFTNVAQVISDQTAPSDSSPILVAVGLPPPREPRFGVGGMMSTDWTNMTATGGRWRRVVADINTTAARNPGLIDLAPFDAQVRSNQEAGLRTYGLVNARPVSGVWPRASDLADAFGRYVERYDGDGLEDMPGLTSPIQHWELFEEFMEVPADWTGCTVAMYADYLSQAHAVAHARHPTVSVLSSAFVGMQPGHFNYLQQLLADHPWVAGGIDAVSVHDNWDFTWHWDGTQWTAQYLEAAVIRDFLVQVGLKDRPVWASSVDFGFSYNWWKTSYGYICTQTDNAWFLARSVPYALAAGYDFIIPTEFNAHGQFPETLNWTVMTGPGGQRRMNFYVYQKMIEKLEGFARAELLDLGGCNLGARFLDCNAQPLWVLWNWTNLTSQVSLPVGLAEQVRITGALPVSFDDTSAVWSVTTNIATAGSVTLTVDATPIYVEPIAWARPSVGITRAGANIVLTWTAAASDWRLETTSDLVPGGIGWSPIPPPYTVDGPNLQVTEPLSLSNTFYRLRKP